MTTLEAALKYAKLNRAVFPVNGKIPLVEHGVKDATTDVPTILEWWERWPDAGVAVATGQQSGLVALDVDPRDGGLEELERLLGTERRLPHTGMVLTGGNGRHYIFQCPGALRSRRLAPGLELKADGTYIVVPPSRHPNGKAYEFWDRSAKRLAPLPGFLLAVPETTRRTPLRTSAPTSLLLVAGRGRAAVSCDGGSAGTAPVAFPGGVPSFAACGGSARSTGGGRRERALRHVAPLVVPQLRRLRLR